MSHPGFMVETPALRTAHPVRYVSLIPNQLSNPLGYFHYNLTATEYLRYLTYLTLPWAH